MISTHPSRDGVRGVWESLADGWAHIRQRAGHALTRFTRVPRDEVITVEDQLADRSAGWGLLAAETTEHEDELPVKLEVP